MNKLNHILYAAPNVNQAEQVERFFLHSLQENFSYFPAAAHTYYSNPWQPEQLKSRIENQHGLLLCAWANGDIAGLISGTPAEGGVGTIIWLMVDPAYQNKGIGAALLQQAKSYYQTVQAHKIKLTVHDEKAVKFYLREGFITEAQHCNHWWSMDFWAMAYFIHLGPTA